CCCSNDPSLTRVQRALLEECDLEVLVKLLDELLPPTKVVLAASAAALLSLGLLLCAAGLHFQVMHALIISSSVLLFMVIAMLP
ncbi:unnamed protein product, partial [Polarella glacialis]